MSETMEKMPEMPGHTSSGHNKLYFSNGKKIYNKQSESHDDIIFSLTFVNTTDLSKIVALFSGFQVTGLTTGQLIIEYISSISIYQEYKIPSSTIKDDIPNNLENFALMGNIESGSYKDNIGLGSRSFVENTDDEINDNENMKLM
ncbi:9878_t:CDS:2 [Funneliformis mosseae]|uniref:9878_t:CDS:1 n=1 Tax=Funneliformis mosseae TaxID=27381 RepID=A0A9N9AG16_FUNMO|nr:9878_t:CDS:2 [Funneliformis mosseae]